MLKVHAGLIKESIQSIYYGKHTLINRRLRHLGLIEFTKNLDGYQPTVAGWAELQKRYRNFPAAEAWKLATKTSITQWQQP